jgi:hypothetical protein
LSSRARRGTLVSFAAKESNLNPAASDSLAAYFFARRGAHVAFPK